MSRPNSISWRPTPCSNFDASVTSVPLPSRRLRRSTLGATTLRGSSTASATGSTGTRLRRSDSARRPRQKCSRSYRTRERSSGGPSQRLRLLLEPRRRRRRWRRCSSGVGTIRTWPESTHYSSPCSSLSCNYLIKYCDALYIRNSAVMKDPFLRLQKSYEQ